MDVSGRFQKTTVLIQEEVTSISSVKKPSIPPVAPIEIRSVARAQTLHEFADIALGRFHQQLYPAVHKNVGVDPEAELISVAIEKFQVAPSIPIIAKKALAGVAPNYQMVEGAFKLASERSCHNR